MSAQDLGVYGETWVIQEQDAIESIKSKLQKMEAEGEIGKHNQKLLRESKQRIEKPEKVKGIVNTVTPRRYTYDPTFSYPEDLKDYKGEVFYKAGTLINPLDYKSLSYELIFINGEDEDQIKWANDKYKNAAIKPIITLVSGEPIKLSNVHEIDVYFDQGGYITSKFGIKQVPAIVSQEENVLIVNEIKLGSKTNDPRT